MAKAQWNWVRSAPLNNSPLESKVDWNAFLGSVPKRPIEPQRFRSWRYFWDYSGGNMTDQGTHLMDVIQWFTNAGTPRSAVCQGRVFDMTGSEVPDAFAAAFEYSTMLATWTLNYNNDYENGWTIRLEGNNGTLVLDGSGYRIYAELWKDNLEPVKQYEDRMPTMLHVRNFVDCVKPQRAERAGGGGALGRVRPGSGQRRLPYTPHSLLESGRNGGLLNQPDSPHQSRACESAGAWAGARAVGRRKTGGLPSPIDASCWYDTNPPPPYLRIKVAAPRPECPLRVLPFF